MSGSSPRLPLRFLVAAWLSLGKYLSLHDWLFGESPESCRSYLRRERPWLNYHTCHDGYILLWLVLGFVGTWWAVRIACRLGAILLLVLGGLRLHELFLALVRVHMRNGGRLQRTRERTFGITVMAYVQPILVYAAMHACLPVAMGVPANEAYSIESGNWDTVSVLYFSVASYTTVGWGEISASAALPRVLSGVEAVYGILFLVFAINSFVATTRYGP